MLRGAILWIILGGIRPARPPASPGVILGTGRGLGVCSAGLSRFWALVRRSGLALSVSRLLRQRELVQQSDTGRAYANILRRPQNLHVCCRVEPRRRPHHEGARPVNPAGLGRAKHPQRGPEVGMVRPPVRLTSAYGLGHRRNPVDQAEHPVPGTPHDPGRHRMPLEDPPAPRSLFACKGSGVRVSSPPPRPEARHCSVWRASALLEP